MIKYDEVNVGDKLRICGEGATGFANIGDVVTVNKVGTNLVLVEKDGVVAEFIYKCGAERLEVVK